VVHAAVVKTAGEETNFTHTYSSREKRESSISIFCYGQPGK